MARLAVDRRTNREIAQELFITAMTVEGHLARVHGKLAIGGRSQLARGFGGDKTRVLTL